MEVIMKMLSGKIIQVDKKEVEGILDSGREILSCQCKGDYPDELKAWVRAEMEKCEKEGNLMRLDELRRGKITGPSVDTVKTLLRSNKLFQVELVVREKDFGVLERGYAGDVTYLVNYDEAK